MKKHPSSYHITSFYPQPDVRPPFRGIQHKEPAVYAVQIAPTLPEPILLVDANKLSPFYPALIQPPTSSYLNQAQIAVSQPGKQSTLPEQEDAFLEIMVTSSGKEGPSGKESPLEKNERDTIQDAVLLTEKSDHQTRDPEKESPHTQESVIHVQEQCSPVQTYVPASERKESCVLFSKQVKGSEKNHVPTVTISNCTYPASLLKPAMMPKCPSSKVLLRFFFQKRSLTWW